MLPRGCALLLVASCGRIGFDPEARTDGDAPGDVTATCTTVGPWGTPVALSALNDPVKDDLGPAITPDGLTLYFHTFRQGNPGGGDIWRATRSTTGSPFSGAPVVVNGLNTDARDVDVTVTAGGARVYFASDRGVNSVFRADRISTAFDFGTPTGVVEFNGRSGPWVSDDERETILTIDIGNGDNQLVRSTRPAATWTMPTPITELNTSPTSEGWPSVGDGGLEIVFETNRRGDAEVWSARRATPGAPFTNLAVVDTDHLAGSDDADPELSADRLALYFASNRVRGNKELYVMTRSCN